VRAPPRLIRAWTARASRSESVATDIPATPSCRQSPCEESSPVSGNVSEDNSAESRTSRNDTNPVQANSTAESADEAKKFIEREKNENSVIPIQQPTRNSAGDERFTKRPSRLRRFVSAPDVVGRRSRKSFVREESSGSVVPFRRSRVVIPSPVNQVSPVNQAPPVNSQVSHSRLSRLVSALGRSESSRSSRVVPVGPGESENSSNISPTAALSSHRDEFFHQCIFCFGKFENERRALQNESNRLQHDESKESVSTSDTQSDSQSSQQSESDSQRLSDPAIITPCGHKFHIHCLKKDMMLKLIEKVKTTGVDPLADLTDQTRSTDHRIRNAADLLIECPHPFCEQNISKSWAINQGLINTPAFTQEYKRKVERVLAEIRRDRLGRIIQENEALQGGNLWTVTWEDYYNDFVELSYTLQCKILVCSLFCIVATFCVGWLGYCLLRISQGKNI